MLTTPGNKDLDRDHVPPSGSLSRFHIVFIVAAVLMLVFLGVWAIAEEHITGGLLALCAAIGLIVYEQWFVHELDDRGGSRMGDRQE